MAEYSIIPRDIKQQMMPFVQKSSGVQCFTFRNNSKTASSNKGTINFCPSTMKDYFDKDISYMLTYKYGKDQPSKESITFNSLLDNIPAITIREYIPDTALDQTINFFVQLIKEVMSMFGDKGMSSEVKKLSEADNAKKSTDKQDDSIFKKLWNVTWFVLKYVTGADADSMPTKAVAGYTDFKSVFSSSPYYNQVVKFPHMIYYRLQGCTTTGIYELPYIKQDKKLYTSNGAAGWNADENSGFRFLPKSLTSIPFVGGILGKMFGNIGISWTPWWDAATGNQTEEPQVDITFDLFNDSNDAALNNFIMVNTLIPNNKWIQFGLFQHSSHLYDIKLEGYNRLFACTGQFEVAYDGVLRDPPPNWFQPNGPLASHVNPKIDVVSFLTQIKDNKLIKIPDIYKVKLTFNSVLPANFNNYLYTLVANDNHIEKYSSKSHEDSLLAGALANSFTGLLSGAKKAFTADQGYVPSDFKIS